MEGCSGCAGEVERLKREYEELKEEVERLHTMDVNLLRYIQSNVDATLAIEKKLAKVRWVG